MYVVVTGLCSPHAVTSGMCDVLQMCIDSVKYNLKTGKSVLVDNFEKASIAINSAIALNQKRSSKNQTYVVSTDDFASQTETGKYDGETAKDTMVILVTPNIDEQSLTYRDVEKQTRKSNTLVSHVTEFQKH